MGPPKLVAPWNKPARKTLPFFSAVTAVPSSSAALPNRFDQRGTPVAPDSLATKMSAPPALVREIPPKSLLPLKAPVTIAFPAESTATRV
jgi:hypothetical protein